MTGYLLLTKGEASLARKGALVIMRPVDRNNCLATRVFFVACVSCRGLTGSARRREVSGLAEGALKRRES